MDENSNLEKIQGDLIKFIESQGFLKDIKDACRYYHQKLKDIPDKNSLFPFCFTLKLKFQQFCDLKDIRNVITKELSVFTKILEELVKNFANCFLEDLGSEIFIKPEQVHFNLRISDLPLEKYKFSLRDIHIKRTLSTFNCIVFSTSPPAQYIRQSVWQCKNCYNTPLFVQRDHRDNHKAQKCFKCTCNCLEITNNRLVSDFCSAKVYEANQIKIRKKFFAVKTLEIRLFDDLCQELKVGQEYVITGIFEAQGFYTVFNLKPA